MHIPYRLAKCCEPTFGNRVVGYMNRNGVTIHRVICPSLKRTDFDRYIPVSWVGIESQGFTLKAEMTFEDRIGVLHNLTDIFYPMNINIEEIRATRIPDNLSRIELTLKIEDEDYYLFDRLVERVRISMPEFREATLLEMK